jgi:hypothetical protein
MKMPRPPKGKKYWSLEDLEENFHIVSPPSYLIPKKKKPFWTQSIKNKKGGKN